MTPKKTIELLEVATNIIKYMEEKETDFKYDGWDETDLVDMADFDIKTDTFMFSAIMNNAGYVLTETYENDYEGEILSGFIISK